MNQIQQIKKPAVMFDLDGTIANIDHRKHFVEGRRHKDWGRFFETMGEDALHLWAKDLIDLLRLKYEVIICSGRPEDYRDSTEQWLKKFEVRYSALFMRKKGDFRPDNIIKYELYQQYIKDQYEIVFVVDDRKRVVDMWREKGLVCLQCYEGDF